MELRVATVINVQLYNELPQDLLSTCWFNRNKARHQFVKTSLIVEPLLPKKGPRSKVKWGKMILPATVLEVGDKEKLKTLQTVPQKEGVYRGSA